MAKVRFSKALPEPFARNVVVEYTIWLSYRFQGQTVAGRYAPPPFISPHYASLGEAKDKALHWATEHGITKVHLLQIY